MEDRAKDLGWSRWDVADMDIDELEYVVDCGIEPDEEYRAWAEELANEQ